MAAHVAVCVSVKFLLNEIKSCCISSFVQLKIPSSLYSNVLHDGDCFGVYRHRPLDGGMGMTAKDKSGQSILIIDDSQDGIDVFERLLRQTQESIKSKK